MNKIKDIRESKGVKAGFVAKNLGISRQNYAYFERFGVFDKYEDRFRKIAEILEVDVKKLIK